MVEEQVVKLPFLYFTRKNHFMLNRMDHSAVSLAPWSPGSRWWSITHSYSGPFVSTVNFPETYRYGVHRFFHLCCFLLHNNDLPAFISFNDPLNEENVPLSCHMSDASLISEVESLSRRWPGKGHSPPFGWLVTSLPPKRRVPEGGRLGQGQE